VIELERCLISYLLGCATSAALIFAATLVDAWVRIKRKEGQIP
jgi:hypothetical protein